MAELLLADAAVGNPDRQRVAWPELRAFHFGPDVGFRRSMLGAARGIHVDPKRVVRTRVFGVATCVLEIAGWMGSDGGRFLAGFGIGDLPCAALPRRGLVHRDMQDSPFSGTSMVGVIDRITHKRGIGLPWVHVSRNPGIVLGSGGGDRRACNDMGGASLSVRLVSDRNPLR